MPVYWAKQWELIQEIQNIKRLEFDLPAHQSIRSDQYVMINPATGREVPIADLQYAKEHFREIVESGDIKDERWAFLWYHL